jgi:hypothetical protein
VLSQCVPSFAKDVTRRNMETTSDLGTSEASEENVYGRSFMLRAFTSCWFHCVSPLA